MTSRPTWCLLASAVWVAGCGAHGGTAAIDGDWKIINAVVSGALVPPTVFHDGILHLHQGAYVFQGDSGTYTIVSGTPAGLDIHGTGGPNAGKTVTAIFRHNGDTLIVCYNLSGGPRPAAFKSEPSSSLFLARYVRAR
jgi:uncharacterized protein (TIGR03067 family)